MDPCAERYDVDDTTTDGSRRGLLLAGAGTIGFAVGGLVAHYVLGMHDVVHGTTAWNPHWIGVGLVVLGIGLIVLEVSDVARGRSETTSGTESD